MRLHQTGWKRFLKDNFSCIVIDELFSKGPEKIAVGDINGRVYLFDTVADHVWFCPFPLTLPSSPK